MSAHMIFHVSSNDPVSIDYFSPNFFGPTRYSVPGDNGGLIEKTQRVVQALPDWSCDNCKTNVPNTKRSGPHGESTLCNKCGLLWNTLGQPKVIPFSKNPTTIQAKKAKTVSKKVDQLPHKLWTCDNCKLEDLPKRRRPGPNGKASLCNRCGIIWRESGEPPIPFNRLPKADRPKKNIVRSAESRVKISEFLFSCCTNCYTELTTERKTGPKGLRTLCKECNITWKELGKPDVPFSAKKEEAYLPSPQVG